MGLIPFVVKQLHLESSANEGISRLSIYVKYFNRPTSALIWFKYCNWNRAIFHSRSVDLRKTRAHKSVLDQVVHALSANSLSINSAHTRNWILLK